MLESKPRLFDIRVLNPTRTYYIGQPIDGNVLLSLKSSKKVEAVTIELVGEVRVNRKYSGGFNSAVFARTAPLVLSPAGKLPASEHSFAFTIDTTQMDPAMPATFQGDHGCVRYELRAVVKRAGGLFSSDHRSVLPVALVPVIDADAPAFDAPKVGTKEEKAPFSLACWSGGRITASLTESRSSFFPNDNIPIHVDIFNNSKKMTVTAARLSLVQRSVYKWTNNVVARQEKSLSSSSVLPWPVRPSQTASFDSVVPVPVLPPSIASEWITVTYHVMLQVDAPTAFIVTEVPFTLGTVRYAKPPMPSPPYDAAVTMPVAPTPGGSQATQMAPVMYEELPPGMQCDVEPPPSYNAALDIVGNQGSSSPTAERRPGLYPSLDQPPEASVSASPAPVAENKMQQPSSSHLNWAADDASERQPLVSAIRQQRASLAAHFPSTSFAPDSLSSSLSPPARSLSTGLRRLMSSASLSAYGSVADSSPLSMSPTRDAPSLNSSRRPSLSSAAAAVCSSSSYAAGDSSWAPAGLPRPRHQGRKGAGQRGGAGALMGVRTASPKSLRTALSIVATVSAVGLCSVFAVALAAVMLAWACLLIGDRGASAHPVYSRIGIVMGLLGAALGFADTAAALVAAHVRDVETAVWVWAGVIVPATYPTLLLALAAVCLALWLGAREESAAAVVARREQREAGRPSSVKYYTVVNGEIAPAEVPERALVTVHVNPRPEDVDSLAAAYGIDDMLIIDSLDPWQHARVEHRAAYAAALLKLPCLGPTKKSGRGRTQFGIRAVGVVLFASRIVVFMKEPWPLFEGGRRFWQGIRSLEDVIVLLMQRVSFSFEQRLREMNECSEQIERDFASSVDNRMLKQLASLQKSLILTVDAVNSNTQVVRGMRGYLQLSPASALLLEDLLIDSEQCSEQAEMYSNVINGLMGARAGIINNNLNVQTKNLNGILIAISIPVFVTAFFGMSEFTEMTGGSSWVPVSYPLFLVAMVLLTAGVFGGLLVTEKLWGSDQVADDDDDEGEAEIDSLAGDPVMGGAYGEPRCAEQPEYFSYDAATAR
eukprot:m51a1_g6957 hypothetical protein (1051) ;mRNA; f:61507-65321